MSDSTNHSNSCVTNTSNATGQQTTSSPENPPITSSTQPSPSTSSIGTHAVNRGLVNGNHQAQRTTPTGSTINSDHQVRDNALNNQNDTPPSAMMIVEHTDDPTVRRLHEAFHTDAPQRPRRPFTRASSIAHEMTARDRQEFGLQPDTAQSESASNNNQSTTSEPDGFDLFETPSSGIPPVAVTDTPVTLGVSRDDYFSLSGALQSDPPQANSSGSRRVSQGADFTAFCFHASGLPSYPMRRSAPPSGTAALSSHPFGEASDAATMLNSTPLVNGRSSNSDQRPSYSLRDLELRGDDSNTAGGVYATVHSEADCTHRQAENSNGDVIENGHGRAQASQGTRMNTPPSVNVSELRLGPVSRESHTELALFSQYSEDEPSRAALDEDTTASNSATPVRRRGLVAPLELANHGDRRAPARPNTPVQSQTTGIPPLSDLASHHPGRRASNSSLVHGSVPDNSTRDSTPRDDRRPTRLSNYLPGASSSSEDREAWTGELIVPPENAIETQRRPNHAWQNMNPDTTYLISHGHISSSDHPIVTSITSNVPESGGNPTYLTDYMEEPLVEERGRWTHAFVVAPVESNARLDVPSVSPTQSDQQDRALSAVNNSNVNSRDRRAPRTGGSLRQMSTEENEAFWIEFDDSRYS
ncbi:hypothetical protein PtrSN002B_010230 [Pyrenophora tritici-repentis]|nr:hypothetical protein A1F99_086630 [Pyrenophora tritici-repentis]KAI0571236.1 hypothetical protein Alg215_10532 [Pyrenophora tritici-repentis]KAI1533988.1 hypothetical protein PtrSN002B_010230 [Pyrenophora tritici-repentis]KAI1580583.1 hypothetical protein PtrEW13061_009945 [Pyrenophora tritici-repentis]PZD23850.1 hypothetical protein A1F96_09864 [Pyrenophora tritici-repentis]